MNIFKVLSRGYGKVSETNVSAYLGFLLDPKEQHGLGKLFLGRFLDLIKDKVNNLDFSIDELYVNDELSKELTQKFTIDLNIEKKLKSSSRIDVELEIKSKDIKSNSEFTFLIEVKINDEAVKEEQLEKYLKYLDEKKNDVKSLIFLAQSSDTTEGVVDKICNDSLIFITWDEIVNIITNLLKDHSLGQIDPIQGLTQSLLVAFKQFINSNFRDDVDPEEMRYKILINEDHFYSNFAGRSVLLICKELVRRGKGSDLIKAILRLEAKEKKSITAFNSIIIKKLDFVKHEKDNQDVRKRFFSKDEDILKIGNEEWVMTSQHTEEGLKNFVELFKKEFKLKLTINKK